MKNLVLVVLVTLLFGCAKEDIKPEKLEGQWELRHMLGVQVAGAPSTFEKGNGSIIEFSGDRYKRINDGKVIDEGTYKIVEESAEIDGNKYENRIIFDDDEWKVFIKISGRSLQLCYGTIASDGFTNTYEKL
jgi:hypothetical protein